ncbi:MAG: hypothetical protein V2B18_00355 [Pseudomonadota bacterium]
MKLDKSTPETDLSSIPGEFRENYRFLCELINCEHRNSTFVKLMERLTTNDLVRLRGTLNRRQSKILKDFLHASDDNDFEPLFPPVPAELEASIKIRRKSTWLPWEAEAIQKIELWRQDMACIEGQVKIAGRLPSTRRTSPAFKSENHIEGATQTTRRKGPRPLD